MIDSEANNYFIRTIVTEAGKEDGMSIFSIYILISVVYLTKKKLPTEEMGSSLLLENRCLNCGDEYLANVSNFGHPFCIFLLTCSNIMTCHQDQAKNFLMRLSFL